MEYERHKAGIFFEKPLGRCTDTEGGVVTFVTRGMSFNFGVKRWYSFWGK